MKISLVERCTRTDALERDVDFDDLSILLTTFRKAGRMGKQGLPAWLPATFNGPRARKNVVEVSCFVIDVDDQGSLDDAMKLWPHLQKIVHTSWSHTPDHPKYRVVFPFKRPCPEVYWRRTWAHLSIRVRRSGISLDGKCCNSDRLYFLPAINPDCPHRVGVAIPGEPLDVDYASLPDPAEILKRSRVVYYVPPSRGLDYYNKTVRYELAIRLGAEIDDNIARHMRCPQCGRDSVWYWIEPEEMVTASCNHLNGCSWYGPVAMLDRHR